MQDAINTEELNSSEICQSNGTGAAMGAGHEGGGRACSQGRLAPSRASQAHLLRAGRRRGGCCLWMCQL